MSYTPPTDRAALIELCRTLRTQAAPRVGRMIARLAEEAEQAETAASRVAAAKCVVSFALEGAKLARDLEDGVEAKQASNSVTVLVVKNDSEPVQPSPDELKALLADVSASVRADSRKLS